MDFIYIWGVDECNSCTFNSCTLERTLELLMSPLCNLLFNLTTQTTIYSLPSQRIGKGTKEKDVF
jgi:hypothetical protein